MNVSTLRPGLLVSLATSVTGNVKYRKLDIERDHFTQEGTRQASWQTERTIFDPQEHEQAIKVRGRCRTLVCAVCSSSAFGLLCPEDKAGELDAAMAEARELAATFNATAKLTNVGVYIIAGRIAADDVEAVRAINSEVRGLLADMEQGVSKMDAAAIRKAANELSNVEQMLSSEARERVAEALVAGRKLARKLVKAGEAAAEVVDESVLRVLRQSRTAFLDIEDVEPAIPAAPAPAPRGLDLAAYDAMPLGAISARPRFDLE